MYVRDALKITPSEWDGVDDNDNSDDQGGENEGESEDLNLSYKILGSQAILNELLLLRLSYQQENEEEEMLVDLDGLIQESLYQNMNTPGFTNNLHYTLTSILLHSSSLSEAGLLVGGLLEGIINKVLSRPFQATQARLTALRALLNALDEVGVVSQDQFVIYQQTVQKLATRTAFVPSWICEEKKAKTIVMDVQHEQQDSGNGDDCPSLQKTLLKSFSCPDDLSSLENTSEDKDHGRNIQEMVTLVGTQCLFPTTLATSIRLKECVLPLIHLWMRANGDNGDQQTSVVALLCRIYSASFAACLRDDDQWEDQFSLLQKTTTLLQGVLRKSKQSLQLCTALLVSQKCFERVKGESEHELVLLSAIQNEVLFIMDILLSLPSSASSPLFIQTMVCHEIF